MINFRLSLDISIYIQITIIFRCNTRNGREPNVLHGAWSTADGICIGCCNDSSMMYCYSFIIDATGLLIIS